MSKAGRDINETLISSLKLRCSVYDMTCTCNEIVKLTELKLFLTRSASMNTPKIELGIELTTLRILIIFSRNDA
jgi:hypothetical protein